MERTIQLGAADMRQYCPAVPDGIKHKALFSAHQEVQDGLTDIFAPTFSRALERVGNVAADNRRKVSLVSYQHPRKESPYTIFPPDFPNELFACDPDKVATTIGQAMPGFWRMHEANSNAVGGLSEFSELSRRRIIQNLTDEFIESGGRPRGSNQDLWKLYTQTDITEREQNYATLSYLAADLSGRSRGGGSGNDDFYHLEMSMIDKYFSYQYPTAFHQYAAPHRLSSIISFPLSREMDRDYADRLVRATGFIIGYLDRDPQFATDCASVSESHSDFIKQWMLRAQDMPEDLPRVGVHSLQESVGRAVLPLFAELGRGYEESISTALPEFVKAGLPERVTSHAPLGYIGPVGLQGQGSAEPIVTWDGEGKPTMGRAALQAFDAAVREWRSDNHYKRLVEKTPDARTGLMCPFWSNVVPLTARLILHVADILDPLPIPEYSMTNPYRPDRILMRMANDFGLAS